MQLYNLGKIPWHESQLIYHALAERGEEALSLVSPASPYVCIGYHQDVEQEVDLEFCRSRRIPVFRRDLGGGAVYLDGNQLFFQVILDRANPAVPKDKEAFYRKFLDPVIQVYRQIGIPAAYKPINDVLAGARKISGTGVGEIGECIVFVGNLIVDFDYDTMVRVLNVPDEKFRDKVHKTLMENLTTIRRELGDVEADAWREEDLNALMAEAFSGLLGPMEPARKDQAFQSTMEAVGKRLMTDEWLFRKGRRALGRDVKIRSGVNVVQRTYKAAGGLIKAAYELMDGAFSGVSLSGDFFCYPDAAVGRLEAMLEGRQVEEARAVLGMFYEDGELETPGIEPEDWLRVLSP